MTHKALTTSLVCFALIFTLSFGRYKVIAQSHGVAQRSLVRQTRMQEGAQAMVNMPSIAPLFLENSKFSSTLYIVNEGNPPANGRILLLSDEGHILADKTVTVAGHDKSEVPIRSLLTSVHIDNIRGSLELFDDNVNGSTLVGELIITQHDNSSSVNLDEELLMPTMSQSHQLRGLAVKAIASPIIAVSSTSEQPVDVNVQCVRESNKVVQLTLHINSHEVLVLRPCDREPPSANTSDIFSFKETELGHAEAMGILVSSSDPRAEIQAFGISPTLVSGTQSFTSVSFHDPDDALSSQVVYPGVPIGPIKGLEGASYHPKVSVQNFSSDTRKITIHLGQTYEGISSYNSIATFEVSPHAVITSDISTLAVNAHASLNSIVVEADGNPSDVQVQIWSDSDSNSSPIIFTGKDFNDDRNAGMHPWSMTTGNEDVLLLYNQTDEKQPVNLKISNRKDLWQKIITLKPHETTQISPKETADSEIRDDFNKLFEYGLEEGEISWYTNESGKVKGRVQHVNNHTGVISSFQCAGYVIFCGLGGSITGPSTVSLTQSASYSAGNPESCVNNEAPQLCYGTANGAWTSLTWQWTELGPFTAQGSTTENILNVQASGVNATSLQVEAIPNGSDAMLLSQNQCKCFLRNTFSVRRRQLFHNHLSVRRQEELEST